MAIYIKGMGNISIQDTLGKNSIDAPVSYTEPYVRCIEPNYKDFINPLQLRRMSRIIKRAIASSLTAVEQYGIAIPEAIISGTGLGCIEDTEKFLSAMIENEEKFLQPTYFIQSTHNTISSQIAIYLKCHSYNNTYTHRGVSFEMALWDAYLLLLSGQIKSALVGGYDELTPTYFQQLKKLDFWRDSVQDSLNIINTSGTGTFSGEGSLSFMLADNAENALARLDGMSLGYKLNNDEEVCRFITKFLEEHHLTSQDIDLFMTGKSGDEVYDGLYDDVSEKLFPQTPQAVYKNLSGEFFTASAFGLWSATSCIKNNQVPECQKINHIPTKPLSKVLLYNQYQNKNHSLILLSSCGC